ncbi:MAG TPA: YceI family protein [Hyphomonadaceae bacterium]|nr:YceI family protein [Hyphomonadaceae bacterium]
MRSLLVAIGAAAFLAAPAFAQTTAPAGAYASDRPHTSITWQGLHNGLAWYTARFTNFDIQLQFNPADVTKSKVTATIDPKSVETDFARTRPVTDKRDFNEEVGTSEQWLNGKKFPTITFASTSITKTGEASGKMTGNLTFLGVTKPVTLDVSYVGNRPDPRTGKHKVGFQVSGSFKRSEWGMPIGGPVGDEIRIQINTEMLQK